MNATDQSTETQEEPLPEYVFGGWDDSMETLTLFRTVDGETEEVTVQVGAIGVN